MTNRTTRHRTTLANQQTDESVAYPEGEPSPLWSSAQLLAYLGVQESQIAALEPAEAPLDYQVLSTPELNELSAATTHEEVARIEARIRARIAARPMQLRQPALQPRKVKIRL